MDGTDNRIQRAIRHTWAYLSSDPAIPIEQRATIQSDSMLHWFLKGITIGIYTELLENGSAGGDALEITIGPPPDPLILPPIPNDPEVI